MAGAPTVFVWFDVEVGSLRRSRAMNFVSADALLLHIDLKRVTSRIHVSLNPNVTSGLPTLCALFPVEVR